MSDLDAVTGAFSYTGRHIAEAVLARGRRVRTLTRRPPPEGHPLAREIEVAPLVFDASLRESLQGADTLYNTYWVRFEHGGTTFARAVSNSAALFREAAASAIRRVVHVSVANADPASPYDYFRAKAQAEEALRSTGVSHALVRPTLVYGPEDILVNNIAWGLRHVPVFLVPGSGRYEVQPVSVWDVSRLCIEASATDDDVALDAAGPDRWSFLDFVRMIKRHVGGRALVRPAPTIVARAFGSLAGLVLRDVLATPEELDVAENGLLVSHEPPRGRDRFEQWLEQNGMELGRRYTSELARNFRGYEPA